MTTFRTRGNSPDGIVYSATLEDLVVSHRGSLENDSSDSSFRETVTPPSSEPTNPPDTAFDSDVRTMFPKHIWEPEHAYIPTFGTSHSNEALFGQGDDWTASADLGNNFPFDGIFSRFSLDEGWSHLSAEPQGPFEIE